MAKKIIGQGRKGLLYFAQNPAFHHLTKIGMTGKLKAEDRDLSASNVPDDYDYIKVFQCEDAEWAENCVHNQFERFRHKSNNGRRTEFFWSGCVQDAIEFAEKLKGVVDITELETEEIDVVNEKGEVVQVKRPNKDFFTMGLNVGDEIFLIKKPEIKAVICGEKTVSYKGSEPMLITTLSKKLFEEYNLGPHHLGGFEYFAYDKKDKTLYIRYNRIVAEKEKSGE